ncbi:hypothetical protein K7W42_22560 [Deinococcus sp. HMF7604]|uniref:hypothetical protein n=1 Tax=Deinococcus betulae TaxID=2873312 RepID=UPI001CCADA32|nr:hypothetical protein [Deinococcus betulae]MBZ9753609.1 hypothetical protein [Deinococcus betulae]
MIQPAPRLTHARLPHRPRRFVRRLRVFARRTLRPYGEACAGLGATGVLVFPVCLVEAGRPWLAVNALLLVLSVLVCLLGLGTMPGSIEKGRVKAL